MDLLVNDYHIATIAQQMKDWEEIAPDICISKSEQEEIKEDYQGRYNLQKRQALHVWCRNCGKRATYRALSKIFQSHNLAGLAELVSRMAYSKNQSVPIRSETIAMFTTYLFDCYCDPPMQQLSIPELHCQYQYNDLTLREAPLAVTNLNNKSTTTRLVELSTVLNKLSKNKCFIVLFEGVGGSGKTALSWHICRKWRKKELLKEFHLLIYVQVRNLQIQSGKDLSDIIPYPDKIVCDEVARVIYDQNGKGVCILLDGLDEASSPLLDTLFNMIAGRQRERAPKMSFIVTTRPNIHILSRLQAVLESKIMLEGFSTEKLHEFLKHALSEQKARYKLLLEKFKANPQLEWVCVHPINAVIMAFLAHTFEDDLPITQTRLYKAFVIHFLNRHIAQSDVGTDIIIERLDQLPSNVEQPFKRLCIWAYKASLSKKQLFTAKELGEASVKLDNTLGFLQVQPMITMYGTERYYSFPHLLIQDFFAAVHIQSLCSGRQFECIERLLGVDPLMYTIAFYAGLTCLSNLEVVKLLSKVLKEPLPELVTLAAIHNKPVEPNDPRRKTLALFNCLYECQQTSVFELPDLRLPHISLVKNVTDKIKQHTVSFLGLGMSPSDCIAVGYFMRMYALLVKDESLVMFQMGICSDTGMASFMTELRKGVDVTTPTQLVMRFYHCDLRIAALGGLRDLIKGYSSISSLQISFCISSTYASIALKSLVEGLANGSSCKAIILVDSGISSIHVHYIALLLICSSLTELSIIEGCIQKGMHLFSEALKFSRVRCLTLFNLGIDDTGLYLLGKAIRANVHLVRFNFVGNPVTVEGMMCFLMLIMDVPSPPLSLVIIDTCVFQVLKEMQEYHIILQKINYDRIRYGQIEFCVVPYDFAYMKETSYMPFANALQSKDALRKLVCRTDAV